MIYGIGNAVEMARKRAIPEEEIDKLINLGAVGEAVGCYFNKNAEVISQNTAIKLDLNNIRKTKRNIAVAGGKNKVDSVISTMLNNCNGVLVTDEAIGKMIIDKLQGNN